MLIVNITRGANLLGIKYRFEYPVFNLILQPIDLVTWSGVDMNYLLYTLRVEDTVLLLVTKIQQQNKFHLYTSSSWRLPVFCYLYTSSSWRLPVFCYLYTSSSWRLPVFCYLYTSSSWRLPVQSRAWAGRSAIIPIPIWYNFQAIEKWEFLGIGKLT